MSLVTATGGSAPLWGPRWGSRARDWAESEEQQRPTYEAVLDRVGPGPGTRVLDVGCGTGVFLELAAERGATVAGVDAAGPLLEIARERVPAADLRLADMEALPFGDGAFDLVTGFNAFFFAADLLAALREARRVASRGATVAIQVWGAPERCALDAMKPVARRFFPPPPPDAGPPPELWRPGVLEAIAADAGLEPRGAFDVRYPFTYPDAETLGRLLVAPAGIAHAAGPEREPEVRREMVAALAAHRTPDGAYRLENEWHVLIARA